MLSLTCFVFLPSGHAVVPSPDGGYPGFNTAEGTNALKNLSTGVGNAAIGWFSLFSNTDGSFNTALGAGTLLFNIGNQSTSEGVENTAIGATALLFNTTGSDNTAVGVSALLSNTIGGHNTANGAFALFTNTEGIYNTATGDSALLNNTTGTFNTAVGLGALTGNTIGSFNTAVGQFAGAGVTTASNVICIGAGGQNVDNSCYIGQIFNVTSSGGTAVFINSDGKLGTITSSQRFKEDIKPMEQASEALFALTPITFRYKKEIDPAGTPQFGLVAEDVEKVNPDLLVRDKEGKPYSVRYDQVNAMLLNEFLKEHRRVEEQDRRVREQDRKIQKQETTIAELNSTVAQQQRGMEGLAAQLKEQAVQIQKVNAQIDIGTPVARTALSNR